MTNTFIKVEHNCLEASYHRFEKPTVQTNKVISKKINSTSLNELKYHTSH